MITDEMIEAGEQVLRAWYFRPFAAHATAADEIYRAMKAKEPKPDPTQLQQALEAAAKHEMTPEEIEAQRQSWVRGEMGMGESVAEKK